MTRNAFLLLAAFLSSSSAFAYADSAVLQGLGGAGRAGIAKESLFTNPAGAAFLTDSFGFVNYVKPKVPDFNAGGRGYSLGIYDGQQGDWKGAFAYVKSSRAVVQNGLQGYEDRSDFRFTLAHPITESIVAGAQLRYEKVRTGGMEKKFLQGDLGVILPVFRDMRAGITYENISQREGERPATIGAGVEYAVGFGIEAFIDGTRQMSGARKGDRGYNLGAQMPLFGGFIARGGKFQDAYRRLRGWTAGLGWGGPRASFDYALRKAGTKNGEKDHIFGMNVQF